MLVVMSTSIASRRRSYQEGDIADFPREEAIRLIRSGQAVPARAPEPERAVVVAPETASNRGPYKKRGR